jgi:transposase-like protein
MKQLSPDSRPSSAKSAIVRGLPAACKDDNTAVEFLEQLRWDGSPCCAHCGSVNVYQICTRDGSARENHMRWRCRDCKKMYTVRTGTIFEDSRVALSKWCHAYWSIAASKKGKSALQLKRELQVTYKTALFMAHRIRWAMANLPRGPLSGIIETDETYIGGHPRASMKNAKGKGRGVDFKDRKTPVVASVQRGGPVCAEVVTRVSAENIAKHLVRHVDPSAHLMTDNSRLYDNIGRLYPRHERVNHSAKEYARGEVHTNSVEGFFSLLERGMDGTFHAVSRKHLHRYVSEFSFRYNTRTMNDGERLREMLRSSVGMRLKYKDQTGGD